MLLKISIKSTRNSRSLNYSNLRFCCIKRSPQDFIRRNLHMTFSLKYGIDGDFKKICTFVLEVEHKSISLKISLMLNITWGACRPGFFRIFFVQQTLDFFKFICSRIKHLTSTELSFWNHFHIKTGRIPW